jgi:hypothetical protein
MLKKSIFLLTLLVFLTIQPSYATKSQTSSLAKVRQSISVPNSQIKVYLSPESGYTEANCENPFFELKSKVSYYNSLLQFDIVIL